MLRSINLKLSSMLRGEVFLPSSKSISNRVLVLNALAKNPSLLCALSGADDVEVMQSALSHPDVERVDIHGAGTAMRFLTAVYALEGRHLLTGSKRMTERPISILVDALRCMGAEISYVGQEGFPPLLIEGRRLRGGYMEIPANVSSQYVSALLLIAPLLNGGLRLRLLGKLSSLPYINMTLSLMREFGADGGWVSEDMIEVKEGEYVGPEEYEVESDWSAASYWYEMMALTPDIDACLFLPRLKEVSLQGDQRISELFLPLGVVTEYVDGGVLLHKGESSKDTYMCDLTHQPDLAQTLVCTCALKGHPFRISGVESLRIKETDRIAALQRELGKLGYEVRVERNGDTEMLVGDGRRLEVDTSEVVLETYSDHRMAMSLAPAAYVFNMLIMADPDVVDKSYPEFWDEYAKFR